jgi:hypothetical protein
MARWRTGGLPKNVHIWSKLTAPTARALPAPVLALGKQAFAVFFKNLEWLLLLISLISLILLDNCPSGYENIFP